MDSHRKGDLTEAVVIAELKKRGVPVSVPFGDNERYDVVIETPDGDLLKVQIKTGWVANGTVNFHGKSQHTNSTGNVYQLYDGDVDFFIVYCHDLEGMYWVREDEFQTQMSLRVEHPKQKKPSINWAENYEFEANWPPTDDSSERPPPYSRTNDTVSVVIDALQQAETAVFSPRKRSAHCLVASTRDGDLHRVHAAAGTVVNGRIRFNSGRTTDSADAPENRSDSTDFFLVYCNDLDTIYVIPSDEFDSTISLRVEKPEQVKSNSNWAEDYEFEANWPPA